MSISREHNPVLYRRRKWKIFFEVIIIILIGIAIVTAVREFAFRPFVTSGDSMIPTFQSDDYLVIDELSYHNHKSQRGDIVVFRYPLDPLLFFIKRVIGVPGDTIIINSGVVSIRINSTSSPQVLVEPYVAFANQKIDTSTTTLSGDEYFVLGDNRNASFDSRTWGPVPGRYIIGRPSLRLFPFNRLTIAPGESHVFLAAATSSILSTGRK